MFPCAGDGVTSKRGGSLHLRGDRLVFQRTLRGSGALPPPLLDDRSDFTQPRPLQGSQLPFPSGEGTTSNAGSHGQA